MSIVLAYGPQKKVRAVYGRPQYAQTAAPQILRGGHGFGGSVAIAAIGVIIASGGHGFGGSVTMSAAGAGNISASGGHGYGGSVSINAIGVIAASGGHGFGGSVNMSNAAQPVADTFGSLGPEALGEDF